MIKQYLAIKEQYSDAVLFYRMGDFYEMFFEDAHLASRLLDIALTSRNKKDESPVPMCGVPLRSAQGYIARLIEHGHKVAICDQVEDAALADGLVKREVVRVITPGMVIDDEFLDEQSNNFVLAFARHDEVVGISYADISTGTFRVTESKTLGVIMDEALKTAPREILLPVSAKTDPQFTAVIAAVTDKAITYLSDDAFEFKRSYERLTEHFKTVSLEGFGCQNMRSGIRAAGAVLFYILETQKQKIAHLSRLESYAADNYLIIDELSCRNLELERNLQSGTRRGTLIGVIDHTMTAMGTRLLKNWLRYPLIDREAIGWRHDAVQEAKEHKLIRRNIREALKSVYDIERIGNKIAMGRANARDLTALKHSLRRLPDIWSLLSELHARLLQIEESPAALETVAEQIDKAVREDAPLTINEGDLIRSGYNQELDELAAISRDGKSWLAELETGEKEKTGVATLKVRYNKVFGYYIEVPKSRSPEVPAHYVRKQTLVNAERYITDELKAFEMRVLGAEDQRIALEYRLFNEILTYVGAHNATIQEVAQFLARTDCLMALAEAADQNRYYRPEMKIDGCISIEDGRHPVIEKMITAERFVPNTVRMDNDENQVLIITGPNMAGKSTVLRQVALLVILAQMGSFIPARKASISITDRIFTRVGALDNLSQGRSTFLVEMEETANILNNATKNSLIIMDEIGRGTSTYDGLSIAWAVAEYLHDLHHSGVKTLFATHYHELTELSRRKLRVKNFNIAVKEWNDEIIFLRKLVEGGTNRSYGIQVARLAGIPAKVIDRAKKILYTIENGEHGFGHTTCSPDMGSDSQKNPVQLNLFNQPAHPVLEKVSTADLSRMTPLEALNFLNDLKEMANPGKK